MVLRSSETSCLFVGEFFVWLFLGAFFCHLVCLFFACFVLFSIQEIHAPTPVQQSITALA